MAASGWRSGRPLNEQWRGEPAGFDYYQLLSLLLREQSKQRGGRAAGERGVRFRADLSAAFPGHEVSGVEQGRDGVVRVSSANYCVASHLGPLPEPYTEWARERVARGDRAMADFLDIFNNRLHTLRFEIKARSRPGLGDAAPERSTLGGHLAAFLGLRDDELADRLPLPKRTLLALAGLLADRRRSAAAIAAVLKAFVGAPAVIEQMRGGWRQVPASDRSRLGRCNMRLGTDAVLGRRAWDQQARIGVTIGPLPEAQFQAFLPGGAAHGDFAALLTFLVDGAADCEVRLRTEMHGARLGATQTRLGFASRIGAGAPGAVEACFVIRAFDEREAG